ncbi:MAG: peptidylprolyl isomerase [Burkholderiaceae bacterium]
MIGLGLAMAGAGGAAEASPRVAIDTSMGRIVVELYPEKAPKTVENFLQYVQDGHYDGTIFHRIIGSFMIQGGGYTDAFYQGDLQPKKTRAAIPLESQNGLKNDKGWIAMARTAVPDSATSQFFINTVDNHSLNYPQPDGHGYAVFGKVVEGMDVVMAIAGVDTGAVGPMRDVPREPVRIKEVKKVAD